MYYYYTVYCNENNYTAVWTPVFNDAAEEMTETKQNLLVYL